jgi:hypothetical protein
LAAAALSASGAIDARAQGRTSASVSASGTPPMPAREWVTSESEEPTEEQWSSIPVLRTVPVHTDRPRAWGVRGRVDCVEKVIREWMRITCTPDHSSVERDSFFGVIWAVGGDVSTVKGTIVPASTLESYKAAPQNIIEQSTRLMGASAAITFRLKRGSAILLDLAKIRWEDEYNGPMISIRPGLMVDVSWAHGEPAPYVLYQ